MDFAISILGAIWLITVAVAIFAVQRIELRAMEETAKAAERHHASIQQLHEFYRTALEAIGHTAQYGTPTPVTPQISEPADAEMAIRHAINEDSIATGMNALRRDYEAAGQHPTDAELREEVELLMSGYQPRLLGRD